MNYAVLYDYLEQINRIDLFPKNDSIQLKLAESVLYNTGFNFEKDSLEFLSKKDVYVKNKKGYAYFFKTKEKTDDNWQLDYIVFPAKEGEIFLEEVTFNKGTRIKKDKKLEELINEKLKAIKIEGHYRAKEEILGLYDNLMY